MTRAVVVAVMALACASAWAAPDNWWEVMPHFEERDLALLDNTNTQRLMDSPELLDELYRVEETAEFTVGAETENTGDDVSGIVTKYTARTEWMHFPDREFPERESLPPTFLLVTVSEVLVTVPIPYDWHPPDCLSFAVKETHPRALCLWTPFMGTAWNQSIWTILSLEKATMLDLIGYIPRVRCREEGGPLVFYRIEDVWEDGIRGREFSHASAPRAHVYYRIEGARFVLDHPANKQHWLEKVDRYTKTISSIPEAEGTDSDGGHPYFPLNAISPFAARFLHRWLLGQPDKAREELRTDLLRISGGKDEIKISPRETTSIAQLEADAAASLEAVWKRRKEQAEKARAIQAAAKEQEH